MRQIYSSISDREARQHIRESLQRTHDHVGARIIMECVDKWCEEKDDSDEVAELKSEIKELEGKLDDARVALD